MTHSPPTRDRALATSHHEGTEVVATTRELWWSRDGGRWQVLPWWAIEQAFWTSEDEKVRIVAAEMVHEPVALPVQPDSLLPELVRERVMSSIIASVVLDEVGQVQATFRGTPEGTRVQVRWMRPEEEAAHGHLLLPALRETAATLGIDLATAEIVTVAIQ